MPGSADTTASSGAATMSGSADTTGRGGAQGSQVAARGAQVAGAAGAAGVAGVARTEGEAFLGTEGPSSAEDLVLRETSSGSAVRSRETSSGSAVRPRSSPSLGTASLLGGPRDRSEPSSREEGSSRELGFSASLLGGSRKPGSSRELGSNHGSSREPGSNDETLQSETSRGRIGRSISINLERPNRANSSGLARARSTTSNSQEATAGSSRNLSGDRVSGDNGGSDDCACVFSEGERERVDVSPDTRLISQKVSRSISETSNTSARASVPDRAFLSGARMMSLSDADSRITRSFRSEGSDESGLSELSSSVAGSFSQEPLEQSGDAGSHGSGGRTDSKSRKKTSKKQRRGGFRESSTSGTSEDGSGSLLSSASGTSYSTSVLLLTARGASYSRVPLGAEQGHPATTMPTE